MNCRRIAVTLCLCFVLVTGRQAGAESAYQRPSGKVLEVLRAPHAPYGFINPTHDRMILATPVDYPPIRDLAQPMLRLAGVRIVPRNHGIHNEEYLSAYELVNVADGSRRHVNTPKGAKLGYPSWSPDGKRFAFRIIGTDSMELWVGESDSMEVRQIAGVRVNSILGDELQWMPGQATLLVKGVPEALGPAPAPPVAPRGPNIQETAGDKGASSTYEVLDVLKSPYDEDLFEYYATSQLMRVEVASGRVSPLGKPALLADVSPSPDGQCILVQTIHRPFSYVTTFERFPREVDVWDSTGRVFHKLASIPLADRIPIWGVRTGPRDFDWRPTESSTVLWAEALDGGDWNAKVPHRDRLMLLKAPFDGQPTEIVRTEQRFNGLWWGEKGGLAFINEVDRIKHWTRTHTIDFRDLKALPRLIWDRSTDERYKHPGYPVFKTLPNGFRVVQQVGESIHLSGTGASPDGDRPFLDRMDLKTLKTERLFRCERTAYERFAAWYDVDAGGFLTRRETPKDPPNFFLTTLGKTVVAAEGEATRTSTRRPITDMPDPTPILRRITKRLVKYKRADGVDLSFILYLPPDYKEGTRLPAVLWAYPLDYADPKMAGQVEGSTQRFTTLGWPFHLFFLLEGYAVIDEPQLPVVGDSNKIYDTYMEQLVSGAKAAVDKAVELGVVDRDRIGVMGHSHGALMTANLMAHSNLFRAGVARNGAYNRSLTAFGFQNERRTLWEATDTYVKVSPLFHANKIKDPLLLIHGELDPNPGTEPVQSVKLFEAIRGNGGTARLVMLPFEGHGWRAVESTEHVLYEIVTWFDRYVKNAAPRMKRQ